MFHEITDKELRARKLRRIIAGTVAVLLVVAIVGGAFFIRRVQREQGAVVLRNSILNSARQCCAIEGSYSKTVQHLEERCGLIIDHVNLLTLVSVLLLAVLATLCASTSNAALAMSKRQAATSTSSYSIESCGQAMLAALDDAANANGTDATSAASGIGARLDAIEQDAKADSDTLWTGSTAN